MIRFYGGGRGYGKSFATGNKYGAEKCQINGEVFDSKAEAHRWQELCLLEKAGEISNLRRQVKYNLLPSAKVATKKNGRTVLQTIEREVNYVADFVYEENGETVVEDVKGVRTKEYVLKRKMMLYFHGIRIKEV